MLPSNLLIARTWRGRIRPVFADINRENLTFGDTLISIYQDHIGTRKGDIRTQISNYEAVGYDYRFVRALTTLLERRCVFRVDAKIDPTLARRRVFEVANEMGPITTVTKRKQVLTRIARDFGITIQCLEKSLWSDQDSELVLQDFQPIEAEALLMKYNLSLLQTLLFQAFNLTFTVKSHWQKIFRQIKTLNLIYTIKQDNKTFDIRVEGPLALLKLSSRYGSALAKLVPTILETDNWRLQAEIFRRYETNKRILTLELDSKRFGNQLRVESGKQVVVYDSMVEKRFANSFQTLKTGWTLTREPEPLRAGTHVMLPDFSFEKRGVKVYLEIIGFWTPEYLQRKIEKLRQLQKVDMILAVDKKLACSKLEDQGYDIIYYTKHIPLKPILSRLNDREKSAMIIDIKRLHEQPIVFTDEVTDIQDLATRYKVSPDALQHYLKDNPPKGYQMIDNILISQGKLSDIEERLDAKQNPKLSSLIQVLDREGLPEPMKIISALGYSIRWRGLDSEKALVYKIPKSQTPEP